MIGLVAEWTKTRPPLKNLQILANITTYIPKGVDQLKRIMIFRLQTLPSWSYI